MVAEKVSSNVALTAPFPYFGGKSRVASLVWQALGDPSIYCEPFFGSGAVFLRRPPFSAPRLEIINDADGFVANFWRAIKLDPRGVSRWSQDPASELDLVARHRWLCTRREAFLAKMRADPDFIDRKTAGWWCWGASAWIGAGFCVGVGEIATKKPRLNVNGIFSRERRDRIESIFESLSKRLRHAIICCGDWTRVFIQSDLERKQMGVFLDPPYAFSTGRCETIYRCEKPATDDVERWCRTHGGRRNLRIVLAGFEGEYDLPGWTIIGWKRSKSYAKQGQAMANLARERLWMSPHCNPVDVSAKLPQDANVWLVSRSRRRGGGRAERRRHTPS